uniref:Uncharacterized protein n=1 Tax=Panagrolaimus sp. JU765 TaxID=591449 RepID=A0AC34QNA2_9BILA
MFWFFVVTILLGPVLLVWICIGKGTENDRRAEFDKRWKKMNKSNAEKSQLNVEKSTEVNLPSELRDPSKMDKNNPKRSSESTTNHRKNRQFQTFSTENDKKKTHCSAEHDRKQPKTKIETSSMYSSHENAKKKTSAETDKKSTLSQEDHQNVILKSNREDANAPM